MAIEDLWYRNAILYCLDVEEYMDSNGDGIGDFEGLNARPEYLSGLGVTCVWLLPFSQSSHRDNGYDVSDYYSVDDKHGTLGDFVECATSCSGAHAMRSCSLKPTCHRKKACSTSATAATVGRSNWR